MEKGELFVVFSLALIFLSAMVLASHIITKFGGGTNYNYNSSSINEYKITVNNTDSLLSANITSVNISAPNNFTIYLSSNWTNSNGLFSSSGNNLSWQNSSGIVMNLSWNYFAFNSSSTPGNYNLTITTTNASGSFSSNLSVTINDTTPPAITYTTTPANGSYTNLTYLIFNITATDYGTVDTLNLRIYNSSHDLINTTLVNSTTLPNYQNISNLTEGNYYYNVTVNDSRGNVNNSETRTLMIDTTNPSASASIPARTETTLNFTITISDSGSGIASSCTRSSGDITGTGTTQTVFVDGLTCGTGYTISGICKDRAGNSDDYSVTRSTNGCSSSSDSGGGGSDDSSPISNDFWKNTFTTTDLQAKMGYSKMLEEGERIRIKVENETHHAGVIKISSKTVTINISSIPQQAVLAINETKKFEVSNDNYYDLSVTLNGINDSEVNLTVLAVHEKMPAAAIGAQLANSTLSNSTSEEVQSLGKSNVESASSLEFLKNKWTWIGLIGVILIFVIIFSFIKIRRKKRVESGLDVPNASSTFK